MHGHFIGSASRGAQFLPALNLFWSVQTVINIGFISVMALGRNRERFSEPGTRKNGEGKKRKRGKEKKKEREKERKKEKSKRKEDRKKVKKKEKDRRKSREAERSSP